MNRRGFFGLLAGAAVARPSAPVQFWQPMMTEAEWRMRASFYNAMSRRVSEYCSPPKPCLLDLVDPELRSSIRLMAEECVQKLGGNGDENRVFG